MKVYDYNQEFGGNYYQPMIQYLNKKDIYGPFHSRDSVYLPHSAEVTSDKYTNMRYSDKSSAKHNLDQFLKTAYSKQIKELNGTTAAVHYNQLHDAGQKLDTPFSDRKLLGDFDRADRCRRKYITELGLIKAKEAEMEKETMGESLYQQIRQRNRMARIREACRNIIREQEYPSFDPTASDDPCVYYIDDPTIQVDMDPLGPELRRRLDAARKGLYDSI